MFAAFVNGLLVSLIFYVKFREARAAAALHKAEAERHLLSKQAIEAELKLMQAQVEPHFLFNTLASVQYLTETDPPQANALLGHLIAYLRAALPQLRAPLDDARPGGRAGRGVSQHPARCASARASTFAIDVPDDLRDAPVSAEPADLARRERDQARHRAGGATAARVDDRRARSDGDPIVVTVTDTGRGLAAAQPHRRRQGVGLSNVRERLAALYGAAGRFTLEPARRAARARRSRCRSKPGRA